MKNNSLFRNPITHGRRVWTISFLFLFGSFLADPLPAEPRSSEPSDIDPQRLAPEELKTLLAPIALYPDALIALILPASTFPSDLVLAVRYISSNGDLAQVASQPWDESVKSLVRYPDVLNWMDQNLEWTTTLGGAFIDQPADVMNAIQGLRTEALAAGNLTDSPQQQIVQEESIIRIVPAEPDVIYVPQYDPDVVYVQPSSQNFGPLLTFGAGFAVGSWLNYDFDWHRRSIYVGQWRPGWKHGRDWDRGEDNRERDRGDRGRNWDRGDRGQNDRLVNFVNINSDTARQWQPTADSQRQVRRQRSNRANARLSDTRPPDASEQPGGPSALNVTGNADARSIRVPKPSRPDLTSKRNERIRRESQQFDGSTSAGSPPAPNVSIDTTPRARNEYPESTEPTIAPKVPNEQASQGQRSSRGGNARNLNKRGSPQDTAPDSSEAADAASDRRGRNQKVPAPTVAPNVPNNQSAQGQGRGKSTNARNLNKQESPQDTARDSSEAADATSERRNEKVSAPTVAPNVPSDQSAQGQGRGKGGNARNLDKQDRLQDQAVGASEGTSTMPEPRNRNERKTAPTVAPNAPNEQAAQGPSGGKSGSPRNSNKDAQQASRSNDGVDNRPSGVPTKKQIDRSASSQSNAAPQPKNEQKREQKPPPAAKPSKPPQASAPERQDKPAAVNQNTAPRQSSAPRKKGNDKGGGEKKADEKKNKNEN